MVEKNQIVELIFVEQIFKLKQIIYFVAWDG
jgi:hypothetical protein